MDFTTAITAEIQRLELRLEDLVRNLEKRIENLPETWRGKDFWAHGGWLGTSDQQAHKILEMAREGRRPKSPKGGSSPRSPRGAGGAKAEGNAHSGYVLSPRTDEGSTNQNQEEMLDAVASPRTRNSRDSKMMKRKSRQQARIRQDDYLEEFSKLTSLSAPTHSSNLLQQVVTHPYFDYAVITVVAFNSLLVGAQVQHGTQNTESNTVISALEYSCGILFTLELAMRIAALGFKVLCSLSNYRWFAFDTFLVVMSWVEMMMMLIVSQSDQMSLLSRLLKVVRMGKVMRLIRLLHFLGELRVMAMMIVHSLMSLFWIFCLLLAILYVVACILTQGCSEYMHNTPWIDGEPPTHYVELQDAYGSLMKTMYTLFKGMSGGVSWGEVADPLISVAYPYFIIYIFFIFFTLFSVLNVVTGVFVDSAIQVAQRDRGVLMDKMVKSQKATMQHLLTLLEEIDKDKSGFISTEELSDAMTNPHVISYFNALQVETRDVSQLVFLLDKDQDGTIDIVEFVDGLLQLKGEAKSFDIHMMMMQNRQVLAAIMNHLATETGTGTSLRKHSSRDSLG